MTAEALVEVNDRINQIESEAQIPQERTKRQKRIDLLFDYQEIQPAQQDSLIGAATRGENLALMKGKLYDITSLDGGYKAKISIDGIEFELADEKGKSESLEDRLLVELGKKIRIDALRKHISRDKILDILRTQDAELLAMAGRKSYQGDGFGFVQDGGGNYYVCIDIPTFAIQSEIDGNYYLYDKTSIGIRVEKSRKGLSYDNCISMIKNNGHPYVHCKNERFAEICQGNAAMKMPTSGKDNGEVIVQRLRKMKEVLMFGYTWNIFDPVHEAILFGKELSKHKRKLSELQSRGIPIISKESLRK